MNLSQSLLVEVSRGNLIESRHGVDAVVIDADGAIIHAWGDIEREMYARSSLKPIQALPLIESGAAQHFGYSDAEVALACSSHNAEPIHTQAVEDILQRIGLDEGALECGPHRPYDEATGDDLVCTGTQPCRLHNNCSGKHAGFLATAVHMGEDPAGYIGADHPVQVRITDAMSELTGCDLRNTARGVDGCGIPVIGMPLSGLARGMARMADPKTLGPAREDAARRIVAAMAAHPHMVAGRGRMDSVAMTALGDVASGGVAMKGGAEGVHIAIVPQRRLGIAIKAHDGEKRASETALLWVLQYLGILGARAAQDLCDYIKPPISNSLGARVGDIHVREQTGAATP